VLCHTHDVLEVRITQRLSFDKIEKQRPSILLIYCSLATEASRIQRDKLQAPKHRASRRAQDSKTRISGDLAEVTQKWVLLFQFVEGTSGQ